MLTLEAKSLMTIVLLISIHSTSRGVTVAGGCRSMHSLNVVRLRETLQFDWLCSASNVLVGFTHALALDLSFVSL